MEKACEEYILAFLDLAKAFDTVNRNLLAGSAKIWDALNDFLL